MSAADASASCEVEAVIRRWERAIQAGDYEGILEQHTEDIVIFDVPAAVARARRLP